MNKRTLLTAFLLALLGIASTFGVVFAHTDVHAGNYDIEVGWVDEPPITGQRTAILVNVSDSTASDKKVDVSKLIVNVTYVGQTKTLALQPAGKDTTNQYVAPILPTIPGQYTIQLRGKIGDTDINIDVEPEDVASSDILAFPIAPTTHEKENGNLTLIGWLAGTVFLMGDIGLVLVFATLRKKHK